MNKALLLLLALPSAGCSAAVESGSTEEVAPADPAKTGLGLDATPSQGVTRVYTYKTSERAIEFLMADNGSIGTIEKASMDVVRTPLTAPMGSVETPTLTELFEQIAPGEAVPQELFEGDIAAFKLREWAGLPPTVPALREITTVPQPELQPARQVRDVTCSPDYYNDLWGAQWWIDNYCNYNYSTYDHHQCRYNRTNSVTLTSPGTYDALPAEIFGAVFNGDFAVQGSYVANWFDGAWHSGYTGTLGPRDIWWVHWYGVVWSVSTSNVCPHNGATMNTRF